MSYENELCEAIETIVNNAVAKANYDKTIQATIISCADQTIGKFKCKYQNSSFYAYATSSEVTYTKGTEVYVLVPANNMANQKTILGTTKKLGADYSVVPEGEEAFERIGNNCISSNEVFELCSYQNKEIVLYEYGKLNNKIEVNQKSVQEYITKSSSVIAGGTFKNNLPTEQRFRGNFGIIFELVFIDNATEKEVTRNYVVDVNQMNGNPYRLNQYTRQYGIFEIDGANFKRINKIYIFDYDFPNKKDNKDNDIYIKDIEFTGSLPLSSEELNSCALTFITPEGIYFDTNDLDSAIRKIQAQVRVKGKVVDKNSQTLEYYWFRENVGINTKSEKYNKYGGQGWECLNSYNVIKPSENGEAPVVEWVSGNYEMKVKKSDYAAKETKYKCAVVYNDTTVLTKEISILNYSANMNITIESDLGEKFYYDIGTPTLTCKVNGAEKNNSDYKYQWAVVDNNGNFITLAETTESNKEYNEAVAGLNDLESKIKSEKAMAAASQPQIDKYNEIINKYNSIMRVENNKLYKVQINTITNFSTYKVSVYYKEKYIGTSSIILTNSLDTEDAYSLVIENGSQVFKYNEAGISPTSKAIDNPMTLQPLTFKVYDNLGNAIEDDIIRNAKIKWIIPKKNSLLNIPNTYDEYKISEDANEIIYEKLMGISYTIANKYNLRSTNNNIKLQIDYKGMSLTSKTDFTFIKEGQPGTNGTEFVCKIVPNIESGNAPLYPMITYNEATKQSKLNYKTNANIWFKVQLWHNGENIYEGNATGTSNEGKVVSIVWSVLVNKYGRNVKDETNLTINSATGAITFNNTLLGNPANIIKCSIKYDNLEYYSTMPVIVARIKNDNYGVQLVENTGFRYATYSTDGRTPQYDNANPFELQVTQKINNIIEDISKLTTTYSPTYEWSVRGQYYDTKWHNNNGLIVRNRTGLTKNQKDYKPSDDFNGYCVTNAINCVISQGGSVIAQIHMPVHMLLNKFGNARINSWDGNSVYLNDNGDGVILAPQVGAGKKTTNNEFTGVLIGEVKEVGKVSSNVGLFGYNAGARTIFLNSEAGSAILGNNNGQIIIDPSSNKAMLYSKSYWKNYNNTGGEKDGMPVNYSASNENKAGMLIDLTTPQIKYGNGNFKVDENGHVTAKGGGQIAGWNINDTQIYKNGVYIDSNLQAFYSNNKNAMTSNKTGFYIGSDGFALGSYNSSKGHNPFQVNAEGSLYSDSGSIGGFTISDNTLTSGSGSNATGMSSKSGVQWAFWTGGEDAGSAPFHVGHNGELHSTKGTIGGWTINSSTLTGGNMTINSNGSMSGPNWSISSNGYAVFSDVRCTNGNSSQADTTRLLDFGDFYVQRNGYMHASSGTVSGGIVSKGINAGNITAGTLNIRNGDAYLKMGFSTSHPEASGLNITGGYGIKLNGNGISDFGGASSSNSYTLSSDGHITISPGGSLYLNNSLAGILVKNGDNFTSLSNVVVTKSGNGAQLGNIWVGDHVINDSIGAQISMDYNLDLYSARGYHVRANSVIIGGENSTLNIKRNVEKRDTSDIPDMLRKIDLYDYNYIKEFYNGKKSYGYIIDYLEKIPGFEKYVHFNEDNRNENYHTKIVANQEEWIKFLLGAVIELQKQLDRR